MHAKTWPSFIHVRLWISSHVEKFVILQEELWNTLISIVYEYICVLDRWIYWNIWLLLFLYVQIHSHRHVTFYKDISNYIIFNINFLVQETKVVSDDNFTKKCSSGTKIILFCRLEFCQDITIIKGNCATFFYWLQYLIGINTSRTTNFCDIFQLTDIW